MSSIDTPLITARNITKSYATLTAVRELDFIIAQGEIFALLGPNGAGKTTCVRILAGITRPDAGTIEYPTVPRDRLTLGYLPEERGLYLDQPVQDILEYFGRLNHLTGAAARTEARAWLERLDLLDRAGDKLQTLSKGNQQKVQFIAAVLHEPDWIILDEPFSGLDPLNQELFLELIQDLRREGATILLSAHQMNLVEAVADHILVIDHGQAALRGTMADIREKAISREKIVCRLDDAADPAAATEALERCPSLLRVEAMTGGELAAWIAPEAPLATALTELCAAAPIAAVNSAKVSLHEIFIETVGKKEGGAS